MVGRRPRAVNWAQGHYKSLPILPLSKKRQQVDEEAALLSQNGQQEHQRDDRAKIIRHTGFKDHSALLKAEQRRNDLKRRVLQGMRGFNVIELDRKFRKSPCELKKIKSKPVRQFYESQNNALDDWLEVDALVYAVADDVIDSMNPDADNDGIPERQIPLRTSQGQIDCFLPPEHRAARAKADKQA